MEQRGTWHVEGSFDLICTNLNLTLTWLNFNFQLYLTSDDFVFGFNATSGKVSFWAICSNSGYSASIYYQPSVIPIERFSFCAK